MLRLPATALLMTLVLATAPLAPAASLSGFRVTDALSETLSLARWSVGVNGTLIDRDVEIDGSSTTLALEASEVSGYVGFDVLDWLTVFGTVGAVEANLGEDTETGSADIKWSAGLQANLWSYNSDPVNAIWRLTLKPGLEYSAYQSGGGAVPQVSWSEIFAGLPLHYELTFANYPYGWSELSSLVFYVGPAVSFIDGTAGEDPGTDFSETEWLGVFGGADLYLAENISIGAQLQYFDSYVAAATIRYQFR